MDRVSCRYEDGRIRRLRTMLAILVTVALPFGGQARSEDASSFRGTKLIWPSGAIAFPTGRFARTDIKASSPKLGNKTGWNFGGDVGYFLSEFVAVGAGYGYGRFKIDFGGDPEARPVPTNLARTSVSTIQAWARLFPQGGYSHWQPYILVAAGIGRPVGTIEYTSPVSIDTLMVARLDSKVKISAALTAGIGALVPISNLLSGSMEVRYSKISTKGVDRTDHMTTRTGQSIDVNYDPDGHHLKSKSDTNWWEVRGGLVLTIK